MNSNINKLRDLNQEKTDLIRLILKQQDNSYQITGQDALTFNRLADFTSNNIIYKPRKQLDDNPIASNLHKYTQRFFNQYVTEEMTLNTLSTILNYNKYLTDTINTNPLQNIFSLTESFNYRLIVEAPNTDSTSTPIANPSAQTFTLEIPHRNKAKDPIKLSFRLDPIKFTNSFIASLDSLPEISSDYELEEWIPVPKGEAPSNIPSAIKSGTHHYRIIQGYKILHKRNPIHIKLNNNIIRTAYLTKSTNHIKFNTDLYFNNLHDNILNDLDKQINSIRPDYTQTYLLETSGDYTSIYEDHKIITGSDNKPINPTNDIDIIVKKKKERLKEKIRQIRINREMYYALIRNILRYTQQDRYDIDDKGDLRIVPEVKQVPDPSTSDTKYYYDTIDIESTAGSGRVQGYSDYVYEVRLDTNQDKLMMSIGKDETGEYKEIEVEWDKDHIEYKWENTLTGGEVSSSNPLTGITGYMHSYKIGEIDKETFMKGMRESKDWKGIIDAESEYNPKNVRLSEYVQIRVNNLFNDLLYPADTRPSTIFATSTMFNDTYSQYVSQTIKTSLEGNVTLPIPTTLDQLNIYNYSHIVIESFLADLFFWTPRTTHHIPQQTASDSNPTHHLITYAIPDTTKLHLISPQTSTTNRYINTSNNTVSLEEMTDTILTDHLTTFTYKNYILLDISTTTYSNTNQESLAVEKVSANTEAELNQLAKDSPVTFVHVSHVITNTKDQFLKLFADHEVPDKDKATGGILDDLNNKMLNVTFMYKEINEEIYDMYMQDQVSTYIANWMTKLGSRDSLFNEVYLNGYNESAWLISIANEIELFTLVSKDEENYYKRAKGMVGNPVSYRDKEVLDIVAYVLDVYQGKYYGMNTEEKQEISLFLRSYQDVRGYYFKNLLLKSLEDMDAYSVFEYVFLIAMAFDRFFNRKVSNHKKLDVYNSEDINHFLESYGLGELNEYDEFYDSFDYKMAVVRNYNNLIKNKGTRRARPLIEKMLNEVNNQYNVSLEEYYLVKDTSESIRYIEEFYDEDKDEITIWDGTEWKSRSIGNDEIFPMIYYFTQDGSNNNLFVWSEGGYTSHTLKQSGSAIPTTAPSTTSNQIEDIYYVKTDTLDLYEWIAGSWHPHGKILNTEAPKRDYIDQDGNIINTIYSEWFDKDERKLYETFIDPTDQYYYRERFVYGVPTDETFTRTEGTVNRIARPEDIGLLEYRKDLDKLFFVSMPEGSNRPISISKNRIQTGKGVEYSMFIKDDEYWSKDIQESFLTDPNEANINISKTKYMSISAAINMETVRVMNAYIITILDKILDKTDTKFTMDMYSDDNVGTLRDITYSDLIEWIKFMNAHIGDLYNPITKELIKKEIDESEDGILYKNYYGLATDEEIQDRLQDKIVTVDGEEIIIKGFVNRFKELFSGIPEDNINEFLFDKINGSKQLSMNKHEYTKDIDTQISVIKDSLNTNNTDPVITSRKYLNENYQENKFYNKVKKMLTGIGYGTTQFKNSAAFLSEFLLSTDLITVMDDYDTNGDSITNPEHSNIKTKLLKTMALNNVNSENIDILNLYNLNLEGLLKMLMDYTNRDFYREDFMLSDSTSANSLAFNSLFMDLVELVIETFFETASDPYWVEHLEDQLNPEPSATPGDDPKIIPTFLEDFINLIKIKETIGDPLESVTKYSAIMGSLYKILQTMLSTGDLPLLETIHTSQKNFSSEEYFDFLISMLSSFMSYKVTLYEEQHVFDLSSRSDTFLFAEDLNIWSEMKLEEDWFFDEEIRIRDLSDEMDPESN